MANINYNSTLQSNNTDLQAILNTINELPEAGSGGDNSMLISLLQGEYDTRNGSTEFVLDTPLSKLVANFGDLIDYVELMDINTAKLEANTLSLSTKILILRYDGVTTLADSNTVTRTSLWDLDGDPEYGGTIYVPSAYLTQYRTATNWSGVSNGSIIWETIEGSEYE